jgi:hypothetical protein
VDIAADDAFPPLRHRGKLYQTSEGPGGKKSEGTSSSPPCAKP